MSSGPQKPTGRIASDDRGNSTWEWRLDTGTFSRKIDTQRLKVWLKEMCGELACADERSVAGHDPYNNKTQDSPAKSSEKRKRSLDDMRRLSEEIKAARKTERGNT